MGVDVTHVIKNDFFECNDDKKAMEYSRKTIAKLKERLLFNDLDEEINLHQEEWDGFTLTTFYLPIYDVHFSLHNGFWEIDSYCHYCQIVMHLNGYFHLRRIIYDIAKALDCTEAWHAMEFYTWNGDGEEIWNTNFDNWMEYLHKKLPDGIPEFDEAKILAQGDVHIPEHEELYHDSFKECNKLYDVLQKKLPGYKILGLAYVAGAGNLRCEKNGMVYLINEKTLQTIE